MKRPPIEIPCVSATWPLRRAADRFPEKVAVIEPDAEGRRTTYRFLEDGSSCLAASLVKLGVRPGDRVALWLRNSREFILSFYGVLKAGAVVVPLSTHYGRREVANQLAVTKAKGIVAEGGLISLLPEGGSSLEFIVGTGPETQPPGVLPLCSLLAWPPAEDLSLALDPKEALAILPFSSGTTGLPNGVMLTHANITSNLHQIVDAHQIGEGDLMLNQLPFFHIYGMSVLMGSAILAGATQVLTARFRPVEEFLALFKEYGPTLFFTVPLILQELCRHRQTPSLDWGRLRYVNTGGAPLAASLQEQFTVLTGVPVMQAYGLTEASPTTHANPERAIKVGTVGVALANTEDKIVDPLTGHDLPPQEVGELWIKGPQVMKGYYQDPQATARAIVDGWLRTGDLARKDEDGYVTIVDRLKELIKTKGCQVAPAEIEAVLLAHPDIEDAAVVGESHPLCGEVPVAFVVARPGAGLTGEAVISYAAAGMASYKRLARVTFVEAIPRSPSGKILRRLLKETLDRQEGAGLTPEVP